MNPDTVAFINLVKNPFKFSMFLLSRLPSAFFSGVRVRDISSERCLVTIPFKWLTQNPFHSTYFASLSMAAEMSTGVLAMAHAYQRNPAVSMLVVRVESDYFKKAVSKTTFTCEDGILIREAIEEAVSTGASKTVRARSMGRNEKGETVCEFFVTWSFKAKR